MVLNGDQAKELYALAKEKSLILMEANKTAHSPAFNHLIVMIKSGLIGEVVDIEASLSQLLDKGGREFDANQAGGAMFEQGSYPLLPILKLMGIQYENLELFSRMENGVDIHTKGVFRYPKAVCSFKVGLGVKTEGDLVISGTKGYSGTVSACATKYRNSSVAYTTIAFLPHACGAAKVSRWHTSCNNSANERIFTKFRGYHDQLYSRPGTIQ